MDLFITLGLVMLFASSATSDQQYDVVETEMFSIPISPNMFNWTYQEFDQQYRFHAALLSKPELPSWLRYIYSGRHHSGFIFGTPPRGIKSPITLEVIGLNRQDYETRELRLTLAVRPREPPALHEVELKVDNLNVEDLLDEHRMSSLKEIFTSKLWTEAHDVYVTFLASAIDMGARLPLRPNEGEGLVIRLGSSKPFSGELRWLREEVRPLSRLPSCPREYKRTTMERYFREAEFTLDWCSFELYNVIHTNHTTTHREYLAESPSAPHPSRAPPAAPWDPPARAPLRRRRLTDFVLCVAAPLAVMVACVAALSAVVCYRYAGVPDEASELFLNNIFHICIDYSKRRSDRKGKADTCVYETTNTELTHVPDNHSGRSDAVSPINSLARPYSPKSTSNLAGSYNRPQPPPYLGSNTNSLHRRKSTLTLDKTPEYTHKSALEESLKLLNEANISRSEYIDDLERSLKDPVLDLNDSGDDYVPIPVPVRPEVGGSVKDAYGAAGPAI